MHRASCKLTRAVSRFHLLHIDNSLAKIQQEEASLPGGPFECQTPASPPQLRGEVPLCPLTTLPGDGGHTITPCTDCHSHKYGTLAIDFLYIIFVAIYCIYDTYTKQNIYYM